MQSKSPATRQRHFSASILLPVIVALIATAVTVLGYIVWSTNDIDQRAIQRQTTLVGQVMSRRLAIIQHEQQSVAIWDDAVINTKLAFDQKWVDANVGKWLFQFFGHNQSLILDASGKPIYLMQDGHPVGLGQREVVAGAVAPLVERLRQQISDGGLAPYNTGATKTPISVAEFAVVDNQPAIVSVMPIVSSSRALVQEPGSEYLLADILILDQAYSNRLMKDYLFNDADFSLTEPDDVTKSAYPLTNSAGRIVGFFEWRRDRPGRQMLAQTGPVLGFGFLVAGVVVLLLLLNLRRSSAALEAGRLLAEHQAWHDRLTGLANRASFDARLAAMLATPDGTRGIVTLMMLDLDRFKQVNDTLGHQAGDELLCAVGERLRVVLPDDCLIARFGGDEFAVLLHAERGPADLLALPNAIIAAIEQPFEIKRGKAYVGASVGIVTTASGGTEPRELIRKADIALYEAKSTGRNRAVVYEEYMNEMLQLQRTIEAELRDALARGDQLSVVFQPLIDQSSRKVMGAEALARWQHPKFGNISPAKFIPVAESTGLIEILGDYVLRKACEMGASAPGKMIAVNISPTQLRNPKFSSRVFDILHQSGMRPTDLELEITESILLDDEHISSQNLRTFRAAGIHIALDDFGTGYSSLSYLKRYPVDRIKIDRSFVHQLAQGHVAVAITQAMVTLAHAMDIEVTAEGVETEEQAAILSRLGCNTLQGFLFSAAVQPAQIAAIFADPINAAGRRKVA